MVNYIYNNGSYCNDGKPYNATKMNTLMDDWNKIQKQINELKETVGYNEEEKTKMNHCYCGDCGNLLKCEHDEDLPHGGYMCGDCVGETRVLDE